MAIPLEELQAKQGFTTATAGEVSWLPEPDRAARRFTMISVDDHIVEPPDTFAGRLPAKFADRAPRVVERADGSEAWVFEGQEMPNVGFNAVVGRPVTEYSFEPTRFDEMRPRRVGHPGPHRRHGPQRRVRVGVLPLVPARVRRSAPAAAHRRSRPRPGRACGRGTTG